MTTEHPDYSFKIPNLGSHLQQYTQYGMRQPDGSTVWTELRHQLIGGHSRFVQFRKLDRDSKDWSINASNEWQQIVEDRAKLALLDPKEYVKGYQLVKRTVILAATEAEDVK